MERKPLPFALKPFALDQAVSPAAVTALQVGDEEWFWADDGWKYFSLMALNDYVEVWVADEAGMSYPPGDPRPPTVVRPEQAEYLAEEFETNIWPSDTDNFGLPELRDGSNGMYASWGYDWYATDVPTRTIMLVFNIATDENYYDPTYPSYIIGFYSSDETKVWADRNIIHIDSANWDQYLGPPGKDWGVGEVTAPHEYEATVAHEFQHLIHSDRGQGEDDWIEAGWDYGFVQVTTDTTGMTGWTSLANENTMTETVEDAPATIKNNVPGLTGLSEISPTTWPNQVFDVSAYTGTDILLAFRYAADWYSAGESGDYDPGWWIDNVQVDDTIVWNGDVFIGGDSLKETQGWKPDFRVNFFTYDAANPVGWNDVATMTLSAQMTGTLDLSMYLDADEFGALAIAGVPPMIQDIMGYGITEYLPYTLAGMPASVATSDVTVDFEADDPLAGGLVTYTINVRNIGDVTATVDITNAIPANTTFVATSGEYSSTLDAVRWLDVEVPPQSAVTGTLTVRIDDCVPVNTPITNVTDFGDFERELTFAVDSPFQYSSLIAPPEAPTETELTYALSLINVDVTTRTAMVEMVLPADTHLVVTPTGGTVVLNTLSFTVTLPPYTGTPTVVDATIYIEDEFLAPGSATWPLNQVVRIYEQGCPDVYTTLFASTNVVPLVRMTGVSITGPVTGTTSIPQTFLATVSPITATTPITYTWEATEQDGVVMGTDAITDSVSFTWLAAGTKSITVTAENAGGSVSVTAPHTITIRYEGFIYLPLVMRDS